MKLKAFFSFGTAVFFSAYAFSSQCIKPDVQPYAFDSYYAETVNKTGADLRVSLNHITSHNVTQQSYSCVWSMIEEADQDPANPDNVLLIYTLQSYPKAAKSGRHHPSGHNWNREHLWAKSHGFPKSNQFAYTDGHHLTAADETCNSRRSNMDFAEGGLPISGCNASTSGNTWEPPMESRGNVARSLFYMAVRYEGHDDSKTPDLKLANHTTYGRTPFMGELCTLYRWHHEDPVDYREQQRNDVIYSWQGNRNPFIDHPEWVDQIWGKSCS